jgi:hypothetical protein
MEWLLAAARTRSEDAPTPKNETSLAQLPMRSLETCLQRQNNVRAHPSTPSGPTILPIVANEAQQKRAFRFPGTPFSSGTTSLTAVRLLQELSHQSCFPSASRSRNSPNPSSLIPASILARSPTTTQISWSGWTTVFAASATSLVFSALTLPAYVS